jgi:hypothetical protein
VYNKEEGNISPRMAELRADMGKAATDLTTMQTFDGPGPETINGELLKRLAASACWQCLMLPAWHPLSGISVCLGMCTV